MENSQTKHWDQINTQCQPEIPFCRASLLPEETFAMGEKLALLLEKGSVVALNGPLGAGKTCFAKGIASGLGVKDEVTSPSYTIISEYEGILRGKTIPVFHIDLYRLDGNDDFDAIGGGEIIYGDGISVIEWADRISGFIPMGAINVDIEIKAGSERLIRIYRGEKPPFIGDFA